MQKLLNDPLGVLYGHVHEYLSLRVDGDRRPLQAVAQAPGLGDVVLAYQAAPVHVLAQDLQDLRPLLEAAALLAEIFLVHAHEDVALVVHRAELHGQYNDQFGCMRVSEMSSVRISFPSAMRWKNFGKLINLFPWRDLFTSRTTREGVCSAASS